MSNTESLPDCIQSLGDYEGATAARYREFSVQGRNPGLRNLIATIADQKEKKAAKLRDLAKSTGIPDLVIDFGGLPSLPPQGSTASEFLEQLISIENLLQNRYLCLSGMVKAEEDLSVAFVQAGEESRKHLAWAKDHLDLLGLS